LQFEALAESLSTEVNGISKGIGQISGTIEVSPSFLIYPL
jgi:hypothetical protein